LEEGRRRGRDGREGEDRKRRRGGRERQRRGGEGT